MGSTRAIQIEDLLAREGVLGSTDVCRRLGLSQSTFSRAVREIEDLVRTGARRSTRYAVGRGLDRVDRPIPVYEVGPGPEPPRRLLLLEPIRPSGFVVVEGAGAGTFHRSLPWFLFDLWPSGFLGRLVSRLNADFDLPEDPRSWSDADVLRYLTREGWNGIGSLIAGDRSYRHFVERAREPVDGFDRGDRAEVYPERARRVLVEGEPGSSAGGEQAKFLGTRLDPDPVPVLVKFSPRGDGPGPRRSADLLVAEHLCHEVLRSEGRPSCPTAVIESSGRTFLEVERFDRVGATRRRGVVSLEAIALERGAPLERWSESVRDLARKRVLPSAISDEVVREVRWRELFGRLIGNTDMHAGNLSFTWTNLQLTGVAPVYDMLPMLFAPREGEIIERPFEPPSPDPADADVWPSAWSAASAYWRRVMGDERITADFRRVARECRDRVDALEPMLDLLPV